MKKLLSFLMMGNWAIGSLNAYAEHWNLFAINSLTAVILGLSVIILAIDDLDLTKPK